MNKDYAVNKMKRIMDNRHVFVCRACGLSHSTYLDAKRCCAKQKGKFNKNQHVFAKIYAKLVGRNEC